MRKYLLSIIFLLFSVCLFAQGNSEKTDSIPVHEKFFQKQEMKIYPNPVVDYFYAEYSIEYIKDAKLQVYNSLGEIVISKDLEEKKGNEKIYVTGLKNGLYFCSLLVDDNRVSTKKLLVNR
ncbi:MAG: hypothetical protein A2X13_02515 [Bacteroidetes bacterium GWC2_33_15]|nr:MAG: hypothetical protein A2X10_14960 [Bacteroidetes bacterium GWA2_33_15]OFX49368.1 MAG: hypothetical protein A2X13_02515 [Bacteroidetes bacterium GWC2_33_15]OFX63040.1 MAG: hypothetical protein A2X15_10355 [Bacteroidetes bacterium GWB2_32_14]OFX68715.1 MAG: hypothetical protein A2X14_14040 [Bacteroidetes bacterium GWD2_33_33]HAN19117.1 hypothetical protein [Bacteroidales bacterium]